MRVVCKPNPPLRATETTIGKCLHLHFGAVSGRARERARMCAHDDRALAESVNIRLMW